MCFEQDNRTDQESKIPVWLTSKRLSHTEALCERDVSSIVTHDASYAPRSQKLDSCGLPLFTSA